MNNTETRALIEQAKAQLVAKPKATKVSKKVIDASDPAMINALLAELSSIQDQAKQLKAQEDEIKNIIRDVIGTAEELHVHGAKVASVSRWRETALITDKVKELFPLTECPEIYKAQDKSRLNIH